MSRLLEVLRSNRSPLFVFFLAAVLRGLPEILSGPYPVGYDVLAGYIPAVEKFPDVSVLTLFGWVWAPLAIVILRAFSVFSDGNSYLLMKIFAPGLYGFFASSFYLMLARGLRWNPRISLMTGLIFLLQPAILRLGWDQFRLELGLSILFLLLTVTGGDLLRRGRRAPWAIAGLSVLVVLSQELVAVLLFAIAFWQIFAALRARNSTLSSYATLLPAVLLFALQVFARLVRFPSFSSHLSPIMTSNSPFFTNYLSGLPFGGGGYSLLILTVASLSLYTIVPVLPLALAGFSREKLFFPVLLWLAIAAYDVVAVPSFGLSYFWWWLLLLPIPLTVYAGKGLVKFGVLRKTNRFRIGVLFIALLSFLAMGYSTSAIGLGYPSAYAYMPGGLVESAVPFADIPYIQQAFYWSNQHLPWGSLILVPENFQGFAATDSRSDLRINVVPPSLSLEEALQLVHPKTAVYAIYTPLHLGNASIQKLAVFGNILVCDVTGSN